jgi:hypothetical protein
MREQVEQAFQERQRAAEERQRQAEERDRMAEQEAQRRRDMDHVNDDASSLLFFRLCFEF